MSQLRDQLAAVVRDCYARGWSPATGGNYSALVTRDPLAFLLTPSGVQKGSVQAQDFLEVNAELSVLHGIGKPSAEGLLHTAIYETTSAGAVLHTHSVFNTLASVTSGDEFAISDFEMLKALEGNTTHEATEVIPVVANSQDMLGLSDEIRRILQKKPNCHAFLIRGHGLYTWGNDIIQAQRHLEALEFLFEVEVRRRALER
ncbi:MAG: methylthioribulose 1-phosphate dehydratase [Armatimonadetes bacterium]|nr:methylthioribulose 1-phosphate dehydratase [Armatimonadota bacterium]